MAQVDKKDTDKQLIALVQSWLSLIFIVLSKTEDVRNDYKMKKIGEAIMQLAEYLKKTGNTTISLGKSQDFNEIAEIVMGLLRIGGNPCSKQGIWLIANKVGGFPDWDKLRDFLKILKLNKDGINFRGTAKVAAAAAIEAGEKLVAEKLGVDNARLNLIQSTIEEGLKNPASIFTPQFLFNHFANSNKTMTIEDFSKIFAQLKLSIPPARIIEMFAYADREKKGELSQLDFVRAFERMKSYFVNETMSTLGFSPPQLIFAFFMTIMILILLFVFIFVGIEAFSPNSSFSSVTNSLLPLGAGFAVHHNKQDPPKPEDLKEAVDAHVAQTK